MLTTTIALATVLAYQQKSSQSDPSSALASTPIEIPVPAKASADRSKLQLKVSKGQVAEITKDEVSVRSTASSSGSILVTVSKGATARVTETSGDWVRLTFQNGTIGWVNKGLVKFSDAVVPAPRPNKDPERVCSLEVSGTDLPETPVRAQGDNDRGRRLSISIDRTTASIRKPDAKSTEVVELSPAVKPSVVAPVAASKTAAGSPFGAPSKGEVLTSNAENVLESAKSLMGSRYVWGATGRGGSYDCSGFTQFVFSKNGISLPRTAAEQSMRGTKVAMNELQPGDLVFFSSRERSVGHVGIYYGNGRFIHASSGAGHVTISALSESYYTNHYVGARRILQGGQKLSGPMPLPDTANDKNNGEEN